MHPLFPSETDHDEDRDISWIQVTRWEGGGYKYAPLVIPADELRGLDELHSMFGGGNFELIARSADKAKITHRKKYSLPGLPKPLAPTEDAPAAPPSQAASAALGRDPMMALFAMMMQQQQQAQAQMTQVLIAAMNQKAAAPPADHTTGPVVKALPELATRAPAAGGGGSMSDIMRAMELGAKMAQAQAGGGSEDDLMQTLAMFLQGAMAQQGGPPGPPGGLPGSNGAPPS